MKRFLCIACLAMGGLFLTDSVQAQITTINATGDTILQDSTGAGPATDLFGYGGFPTGATGAFTQVKKPTQNLFAVDRDAIRFDLSALAGRTVTSATLRFVQRDDVRGLQAGTEAVYGFTANATPTLSEFTGGVLLGNITAPGVVGSVVTLDVTAFTAASVTGFGGSNSFAVFRLQDPVTTDVTGNPYSLSFSNDRTPNGQPLQLIVNLSPCGSRTRKSGSASRIGHQRRGFPGSPS